MITVDFEKLTIRPGDRILDIGCGSGRHVCAAVAFEEVMAVGADRCLADLQKARERIRFHQGIGAYGGGPWETPAADITALPFKTGSFDHVICAEVLEHIPEEQKAMREIVRVLKPGGSLVVSVPRYLPEKICWILSDQYAFANQGHIRIYRKRELIARLEAEGVKSRGFHFAHSLHAPYWWLKCLVGPTRDDSGAVNLYHRFLVWDMMEKPRVTRWLDRILNPLVGKSLVVYFRKFPA